MSESEKEKFEKFKRILPGRIRILNTALRRIGNLSHRYNYRYTKEDIDKLFKEIRHSVNAVESNFRKELKEVPVGGKPLGRRSVNSPRPVKVAKPSKPSKAPKPVEADGVKKKRGRPKKNPVPVEPEIVEEILSPVPPLSENIPLSSIAVEKEPELPEIEADEEAEEVDVPEFVNVDGEEDIDFLKKKS